MTYRLNCSEEFTRAKFGHSEVFEIMTDEWPFFLTPGDKFVPVIAFGKEFLVELHEFAKKTAQNSGFSDHGPLLP
jgi:hypothetical protein